MDGAGKSVVILPCQQAAKAAIDYLKTLVDEYLDTGVIPSVKKFNELSKRVSTSHSRSQQSGNGWSALELLTDNDWKKWHEFLEQDEDREAALEEILLIFTGELQNQNVSDDVIDSLCDHIHPEPIESVWYPGETETEPISAPEPISAHAHSLDDEEEI